MNSSLDLKDKYYKIIDDWINGFTIDKIKIYLFSEPIIKLPISDTEIEENDIILQEKVILRKLLGLDKEDISEDEKYFNTNIMNVIDHINSNIDSKEYSYKKFIEFSLKFTELYDIIYKLHKYMDNIHRIVLIKSNIIDISTNKNYLDLYIDSMVRLTTTNYINIYYNFKEFYSKKEEYINDIYHSFNFLFPDNLNLVKQINIELYLITPSATILKVSDFDKINNNIENINKLSYQELNKYSDISSFVEDKGLNIDKSVVKNLSNINTPTYQESMLNTIRNTIAYRFLPDHIVEEIGKKDEEIEDALVDNLLRIKYEDPETENDLIMSFLDKYTTEDDYIKSVSYTILDPDMLSKSSVVYESDEELEEFFNKLGSIYIKEELPLIINSEIEIEKIEYTKYLVYTINISNGLSIMRIDNEYEYEKYHMKNNNIKNYKLLREINGIKFYLLNYKI